jgi:hypothetical protein
MAVRSEKATSPLARLMKKTVSLASISPMRRPISSMSAKKTALRASSMAMTISMTSTPSTKMFY